MVVKLVLNLHRVGYVQNNGTEVSCPFRGHASVLFPWFVEVVEKPFLNFKKYYSHFGWYMYEKTFGFSSVSSA